MKKSDPVSYNDAGGGSSGVNNTEENITPSALAKNSKPSRKGKAVTFELKQKEDEPNKSRQQQRSQKRGQLQKGLAKTQPNNSDEHANMSPLMPSSLQGAGVILPNIVQEQDAAIDAGQEKDCSATKENQMLYLPSLLLRSSRGRRGSSQQGKADVKLEVMGQDLQVPPPKPVTEPQTPPRKKPEHKSGFMPSLQTFREADEVPETRPRQNIDNNLRKVLECHSIGIPLEITRPQFVRARHARPIFHCRKCRDHWARIGRLPPKCEQPEDQVLGPVIEISTKAASFLQTAWLGRGVEEKDADHIMSLRDNLRTLLKKAPDRRENGRYGEVYSDDDTSNMYGSDKPIHKERRHLAADIYVDSDEEGLSYGSSSYDSETESESYSDQEWNEESQHEVKLRHEKISKNEEDKGMFQRLSKEKVAPISESDSESETFYAMQKQDDRQRHPSRIKPQRQYNKYVSNEKKISEKRSSSGGEVETHHTSSFSDSESQISQTSDGIADNIKLRHCQDKYDVHETVISEERTIEISENSMHHRKVRRRKKSYHKSGKSHSNLRKSSKHSFSHHRASRHKADKRQKKKPECRPESTEASGKEAEVHSESFLDYCETGSSTQDAKSRVTDDCNTDNESVECSDQMKPQRNRKRSRRRRGKSKQKMTRGRAYSYCESIDHKGSHWSVDAADRVLVKSQHRRRRRRKEERDSSERSFDKIARGSGLLSASNSESQSGHSVKHYKRNKRQSRRKPVVGEEEAESQYSFDESQPSVDVGSDTQDIHTTPRGPRRKWKNRRSRTGDAIEDKEENRKGDRRQYKGEDNVQDVREDSVEYVREDSVEGSIKGSRELVAKSNRREIRKDCNEDTLQNRNGESREERRRKERNEDRSGERNAKKERRRERKKRVRDSSLPASSNHSSRCSDGNMDTAPANNGKRSKRKRRKKKLDHDKDGYGYKYDENEINQDGQKRRQTIHQDYMLYEKYANQGKTKRRSLQVDFGRSSPNEPFLLPGRQEGIYEDMFETIVDQLLVETSDYTAEGYVEVVKRAIRKPIYIPDGSGQTAEALDFQYETVEEENDTSLKYFEQMNDQSFEKEKEHVDNKRTADQASISQTKQSESAYKENGKTGSHGELLGGIAYDTSVISSATMASSDMQRGTTGKARRRKEKAVVKNPLVKNKTGRPETNPGKLERNIMATPSTTGTASRRGSLARYGSTMRQTESHISQKDPHPSGMDLPDKHGKGGDSRGQASSKEQDIKNHSTTSNDQPVAAHNFDIGELPDASVSQENKIQRKTNVIKKKKEVVVKREAKAYHSKEVKEIQSKMENGPKQPGPRPESNTTWRSSTLPGPDELSDRKTSANVGTVRLSQGANRRGSVVNKQIRSKMASQSKTVVAGGTEGESEKEQKSKSDLFSCGGKCEQDKDTQQTEEFIVEQKPQSDRDGTEDTETESSASSISTSEKASLMSLSQKLKEKTRFVLPDLGGISNLSFTPAFTYSVFEVPNQYRKRNEDIRDGKPLPKSNSVPPLRKTTIKQQKKTPKKKGAVGRLAKKIIKRVCDPKPLARYVKKLQPLPEIEAQKDGSGDNKTGRKESSFLDDSNENESKAEPYVPAVTQESEEEGEAAGVIENRELCISASPVEVLQDSITQEKENSNYNRRMSDLHAQDFIQVEHNVPLRGLLGGKESVVMRVQDY